MDKKVVFVSHSKKDATKVNRLLQELRAGHFDVTNSSHKEEMDTSHLDRACAFVVCLSAHYSTDDACHNEFLMIHWQEKPLVPVVLDSVSWPPGDNLFIHRDFFWNLTSLMLDLTDEQNSGHRLVPRLNTALGITDDEKEDSWRVSSPRKTAPSPAALSSSQQKAKDEEIMMQLAMQSAEYQKLASAPPSVSGRVRSGVNSIDQPVISSRHRSATSARQPSSSRRSSLLTVTTVEESGERPDVNIVQDENDNAPEPEVVARETIKTSENTNTAKQKNDGEGIEKEKSPLLRTSEEQVTLLKTAKETSEIGQSPSNDDGKLNENSPHIHKRRPSGGSKKSKACSIL
ncbi:uncharacterized protein LOC135467818 [Liolophura sinensis]|uniref:uncharacterized protein LOC135467818 n=1 Tax=Liolophura sinensis TaxID=3198878 RepID=UPI0031598AE9